MKRLKMPWTKRADRERELRLAAEAKHREVEEDWAQLQKHRQTIDREIALNDWTNTAITLFSGKGN